MALSNSSSDRQHLLLGVDGGGTRCRARLCTLDGEVLGEASAGPANIRFGVAESIAAVSLATEECWRQAQLEHQPGKIVACLALAGASEPELLAKARAWPSPFLQAVWTTDAHAACVGAHAGQDGGIIIVGTGSIGWGRIGQREFRVGGWGFPISDEGSGAWIGLAALRNVQWAFDGMIGWTTLLQTIFSRFGRDPHHIVRWMHAALPRDYAALAPIVVSHASSGDAVALALMREAAGCIERMAKRLCDHNVGPLALMGGLAGSIQPYLSSTFRRTLVQPKGDALNGAVLLARRKCEAMLPPPRDVQHA
jgi:glucosamine kinase